MGLLSLLLRKALRFRTCRICIDYIDLRWTSAIAEDSKTRLCGKDPRDL